MTRPSRFDEPVYGGGGEEGGREEVTIYILSIACLYHMSVSG